MGFRVESLPAAGCVKGFGFRVSNKVFRAAFALMARSHVRATNHTHMHAHNGRSSVCKDGWVRLRACGRG